MDSLDLWWNQRMLLLGTCQHGDSPHNPRLGSDILVILQPIIGVYVTIECGSITNILYMYNYLGCLKYHIHCSLVWAVVMGNS